MTLMLWMRLGAKHLLHQIYFYSLFSQTHSTLRRTIHRLERSVFYSYIWIVPIASTIFTFACMNAIEWEQFETAKRMHFAEPHSQATSRIADFHASQTELYVFWHYWHRGDCETANRMAVSGVVTFVLGVHDVLYLMLYFWSCSRKVQFMIIVYLFPIQKIQHTHFIGKF